jgi:hypothetical protein
MAKKEKNLTNRAGVWYWTQTIRGRRYAESLQTPDLKLARERMKIKRDAALSENWETLYGTRTKSAFPTLGRCLELYLTEAQRRGRPAQPTARRNCGQLRKILDVAGIANPDAASVSVLTVDLLETYTRRMLEANDTPSARRSIASTIRQARSVFAAKLNYHHDFILPKTMPRFLTANIIEPDPVDNTLPEPDIITALVKAGRELRGTDPALYLAFVLCYDLGLRNGEARDCRQHWFYQGTDGINYLDIINRETEGYRPKTPRVTGIPVPAAILADIKALGGEDYVLPLGKTARLKMMKYGLSDFVREHIKTGTKSVYVLRRLRGSFWTAKYGMDRTHYWMGHRSMQITKDHYAKLPKIAEPHAVDDDLTALRKYQ